jgi:SAM-dependent methyltransferase
MFKFNNWDVVSKISIDKLASLIITDKSVDNINSDKLLYNYIPTDVNFTILDFGCGIGRNTLDIANKFPNVTIIGYDNSSMLSRVEEYSLRRYNKKLEEYKNVQLISDWAFIKNIKFDFIFATLVFQHINEDDLTVYLNDIRNMTDKLLVSGRRFNDESVNGIYKNTWEILQKNNYVPVSNKRTDNQEFNVYGDPNDHFSCLYIVNKPSNSIIDIDDSVEIVLGRGWHNLEGTDELCWRWTSELFFVQINNFNYDFISIESANLPYAATVKFYTKYKDSDDYQLFTTVSAEKDKKLFVKIPLNNVVEIRCESSTFTPSDIDPKSQDNRKLGIRVNGFTMWKNEVSNFIGMNAIFYYKDDISYKKLSYIETHTDKFFQFPKVQHSSNLDNYTVLLTCHGDRLSFGKKAYQSIIDAGITNIVIVVSGFNFEYVNWAKQLSKKHKVVIIEDERNNNLCWIEGLKNVTTNWVTILHDDDIILSEVKNAVNLMNENCAFGVWKGSVENFITKKTELNSTLDIELKTGVYKVDVIKDYIIRQGYSLSPIHGIFPTDKLLSCLIEWEQTHGNDKFFYERPSFVVGNDIYIWSHFTKNSDNLFLFFQEKCVKCISHDSSATQIDINRKKIVDSNFIKIYSKVKSLHIKNNLKVGIIFYVHQMNDGIKKCIDNINDYKLSKYNIPFVVYSDSNLDAVNFVKFNKMEEMQAGLYRKCDKYAFWAFVEGIRIAKEKGWDYFFCYEWDCLISKDYWFDILWQEHLAWPYEPIITGTPAIRMPKLAIGNFFQSIQDYVYNYSKECKVSINIDHASPISIYTNGALTFYNTEKMCEFFNKELYGTILNKSEHVDEVGPWDFGLGIRIYNKLKEDSFKRVGWLPSSYSGCGDFCYNEKQRLNMLETNLKVIMHQYKYI